MTSSVNLIPDNIDWRQYLVAKEIPKVIRGSTAAEDVIEYLYGDSSPRMGDPVPWSKMAGCFELRPGEMTLWAGINGHGKSLAVSQAMLRAMRNTSKVLIASFEMPVVKTMTRMVQQAAGNSDPTVAYIRRFHEWTHEYLWLYNHYGRTTPEKMLAVMRWAHENIGFDHMVIDSLMKLSIGPEDWEAQKNVVGDLHGFAMSTGVHVHLVAHMRKSEREGARQDKFSVRGAGEIVDQVDNLVIVQRNVDKEAALDSGDAERAAKYEHSPDALLWVAKQRNFSWEHRVGVYFNAKAQSFSCRQDAIVDPLDLGVSYGDSAD